jgi:hypothetical protein
MESKDIVHAKELSNKPDEQWGVYEANVQMYRSNFLSSQSILLAVGAIILNRGMDLCLFLFVVSTAMVQIWYIWYRVIKHRIFVVDFHKFNMGKIFTDEGCFLLPPSNNYLKEKTYAARSPKIRGRVNRKMAVLLGLEKFSNWRKTRCKLDILLPVFITLVWLSFVIVEISPFLSSVLKPICVMFAEAIGTSFVV